MPEKLGDDRVYLRKVIRAIDGYLQEHPKIFVYSGEKPTHSDIALQTQTNVLYSDLERVKSSARLILRYLESSKTVYMVQRQDGELVRASREQVMKILIHQDERKAIKEALPDVIQCNADVSNEG